MTRYLHTNNASSNLRTAINAAVTSLQVTSGHGVLFPNPLTGEGFFVTVEDRRIGRLEIMLCTARSSDTLTVVRGQQGTVPQSFVAGVNVANRVTAQVLNDFVNGTIGLIDISRIPPITSDKIVSLDAAKLTGTINNARLVAIPSASIAALDSVKLTGTIPAARLPNPLPAANLPDIPSAKLTVVPAASLTGLVPTASLPNIPSTKLTSVPAGNLTGTVPDVNINGAYDGFSSIRGTGHVAFVRFLGTTFGSGTVPTYSWEDASDAGMGYNPTLGVYLAFAGAARFLVTDDTAYVASGVKFAGSGAGLTSLPAASLTGSVPAATLEAALHALVGSEPMYAVRGWCRANVSNTTPTVVAHGNIPACTYDGAKVWRFAFSTPMANANYCAVVSADHSGHACNVYGHTTSYFLVFIDFGDVNDLQRISAIVIQ